MLRSFIRFMRAQPKVVRNQYALIFSTVFTSAVALIWIFTNAHAVVNDDSVARADEERATPFGSLFKQIGNQFASVRGSVTDLQEQLSTTTSSTTPADPRELVLTAETRDSVSSPDPDFVYSTSTAVETLRATTTASTTSYGEVQIVTIPKASSTSASSSPQ